MLDTFKGCTRLGEGAQRGQLLFTYTVTGSDTFASHLEDFAVTRLPRASSLAFDKVSKGSNDFQDLLGRIGQVLDLGSDSLVNVESRLLDSIDQGLCLWVDFWLLDELLLEVVTTSVNILIVLKRLAWPLVGV